MSFTHVAGGRNILGETWIDAEERAYPSGALRNSWRKGLVRFPDGKLRVVTLGVADSFFTIPARASRSFDGQRHGYIYVPETRDGQFLPDTSREFTFVFNARKDA